MIKVIKQAYEKRRELLETRDHVERLVTTNHETFLECCLPVEGFRASPTMINLFGFEVIEAPQQKSACILIGDGRLLSGYLAGRISEEDLLTKHADSVRQVTIHEAP